jgi:hypothetical protein
MICRNTDGCKTAARLLGGLTVNLEVEGIFRYFSRNRQKTWVMNGISRVSEEKERVWRMWSKILWKEHPRNPAKEYKNPVQAPSHRNSAAKLVLWCVECLA